MVFEHLWDCFHLEDSTNGFFQLFQLCFHIAKGHIPLRITRVFGIARLLTMTKLLGGDCPIAVGEALYHHKLCLMSLISQRFCNTFLPTPI
jgi:hypothetical protein